MGDEVKATSALAEHANFAGTKGLGYSQWQVCVCTFVTDTIPDQYAKTLRQLSGKGTELGSEELDVEDDVDEEVLLKGRDGPWRRCPPKVYADQIVNTYLATLFTQASSLAVANTLNTIKFARYGCGQGKPYIEAVKEIYDKFQSDLHCLCPIEKTEEPNEEHHD